MSLTADNLPLSEQNRSAGVRKYPISSSPVRQQALRKARASAADLATTADQDVLGIYATIVPLLAYAIVGPSQILVLGPDLALAPLILISNSDDCELDRFG